MVSSDRPAAPIMALTRSPTVAGRMHLLWGVFPQIVKKEMSTRRLHRGSANPCSKSMKLAKKGDFVIHGFGLARHRRKGHRDHGSQGGLTISRNKSYFYSFKYVL